MFQIVGANTRLGHSSMVLMIESQIAYILDALATMREHRMVTVEPKADAQQKWNDDIQRRMKRTVWNNGGCSSWYLDAHGRNVTLWPRTTFKFRQLTAGFDPDAYLTTGGAHSAECTDPVVAGAAAGAAAGAPAMDQRA